MNKPNEWKKILVERVEESFDTGKLKPLNQILAEASEWHTNGLNNLSVSHPKSKNKFLTIETEGKEFFSNVINIKHTVSYVAPERTIYRIENSRNTIIEVYDCWFEWLGTKLERTFLPEEMFEI
jgi:hypothetical protein